MAVTSLEVPFRADRPRDPAVEWWDRWGWPPVPLRIVIVLLLAGVLAGAAARLDYVYSFQPFGFGSGGVGPTPYGGSVKTASDGLADTEYVLVGTPGTTGTVEYPLGNRSDQDVRVLGLAPGTRITSLHWSTLRDPFTRQSFPMTLRAHDSLTLLVTVTKPTFCGEGRYDALIGIPIRYEAMGVAHTYVLSLAPGGPFGDSNIPILLCADPHRTVNMR